MEKNSAMRYFETAFNASYLIAVLVIGAYIILSANSGIRLLYGLMAIVLVLGDSFHLVPRIAAAITGDRKRFIRQLGIGKMITSLSMTLFYVILWHIGLLNFHLSAFSVWTFCVYASALFRIALSVMPQNKWAQENEPFDWSIYRNIPFLLLGSLVEILFLLHIHTGLSALRWMWLAILLSFAFYIPVVLGSKKYPWLGILMIPKTCAYVWIITMGLGL
jgi:hypothetical protein